ncbi:MAG: TrmH family RNA methyltransferase [Chloroflexi bacterium]|nr:TrmH family RNA methyltransferase [Chloroflexota bacterium]
MRQNDQAGQQVGSQVLYERQKRLRESGSIQPGPAIVAVGLRVPENLGMVLRLADAAGTSRVVFVNEETPLQSRIRKTARNADLSVSWEICDAKTFLQKHVAALQPMIAVEITTRSTNLFETELPQPCALVVGSEQHGVPAEILRVCERAVHIPLYGVNGSMNVTHALAIALFEWRRQYVRVPIPSR